LQINIPVKRSHGYRSLVKAQAQLFFMKSQCIPSLQTWVWDSMGYAQQRLLDSVQQRQTVICHLNRWLLWLQVKSLWSSIPYICNTT